MATEIAAASMTASGGGGEEGRDAIIERAILRFLQSRGYNRTLEQLKEESDGARGRASRPSGGLTVAGDVARIAASMATSDTESTASRILFWGDNAGDPSCYTAAYNDLCTWTLSSLDMFKEELYPMLYPLFVLCYLSLVGKGFKEAASKFFALSSPMHRSLHEDELRHLAGVNSPELMQQSEVIQRWRRCKYRVCLSSLSFELLCSFLSEAKSFSLLFLINERIDIRIVRSRPIHFKASGAIASEDEEEAEEYEDDHSDSENEKNREGAGSRSRQLQFGLVEPWSETEEDGARSLSEKRARLPDDENPEHLGLHGAQMQSLHKETVRWGVFPVRRKKASQRDESHGDQGEKLKKGEDAIEVAPASKHAPDRRDIFNSEVLQKLVLQKDQETQKKELEDIRRQVTLSSTALPSALCYNFKQAVSSNCIHINDSARMVVSGHADSVIRLWRAQRGAKRRADGEFVYEYPSSPQYLVGHSGAVYSCCTSPDGLFTVSGSADGTMRLWASETGDNLACYRGHNFAVWDVSMSPLGFYMASASMDRTARLWSTDRIQPLRIFVGHTADVECVLFHPNVNYLATGGGDRTVRMWDIQSGSCVRVFSGPHSATRSLAFSPDGRLLAAAGQDAFVSLWDVGSGRRIASLSTRAREKGSGKRNGSLTHIKSTIESLSFAGGDGALLAAGGSDGIVRIYDVKRALKADAKDSPTHGLSLLPQGSTQSANPTSSLLLQRLEVKNAAIRAVSFTARNLLLVAAVEK